MCTAIQPIIRSEAGVPRSGRSAQRCVCRVLAPKVSVVIYFDGILSANGTSKKMRIDFADALNIRRDFSAPKTGAPKCAPPIIFSQKARVRSNFGICLDIRKTFQNLKHQLGVDRLIDIGTQAFTDNKPAIAWQSRKRLIQAKQKIFGHVQNVNGIYEVELTRSDALSIPWQIKVE